MAVIHKTVTEHYYAGGTHGYRPTAAGKTSASIRKY
jgi:hypothetical protein